MLEYFKTQIDNLTSPDAKLFYMLEERSDDSSLGEFEGITISMMRATVDEAKNLEYKFKRYSEKNIPVFTK